MPGRFVLGIVILVVVVKVILVGGPPDERVVQLAVEAERF
jgi:hypothetical protein